MARRIALILAAVLGVYLLFATSRALDFLSVDDPVAKLFGVAILTMPLLGIAVIIKEVRFGFKTSEMAKQVNEALLPTMGMAEDEKFQYLQRTIAPTQNENSTWQDWYYLAVGCDLTGERKLAREAMRWSVHLYDELNSKTVSS